MHAMEYINDTLYVAGFYGIISNGLATMIPSTGALTIIRDDWSADTNGDVMTGIAYKNGVLYGITNGSSFGKSALYTIDITNGNLTLINQMPPGLRFGSLAFGPDGNLYAGAVASNKGALYRLNTSDATPTLVGNTGFSSISGLMCAN